MLLKEYFDTHDVFNMENGMHMTECEPGKAAFEVYLEEKHMSHVGRTHAHAGVLYSLAESAGAAAVLSYGYECYGMEGNITYLGTVSSGTVRAVAKCKDNHDSESVQIRVRIYDDQENLIAKANFVSVYTGEGSFEAWDTPERS